MRRPWLLLAAVVLAIVATACGSDGDSAQPDLTVSGGETGSQMWFDPQDAEIDAGDRRLRFDNVGVIHHELAIESPSGQVLAARSIAGGTSVELDVDLSAPGLYRMVCREPGHEAAGMVGTLTVR